MNLKHIIVDIICVLFVMLFIYAATSKLIDLDKFQVQLGQSPLITPITGLVVWAIPLLEIVISVLLITNRTRLIGLYAAFTLMALFSFYIIAITRYSYFIPCSCGGVLQHMSWNQHLVFNLFFVALGVTGILLDETSISFIAIKQGKPKT